MSDKIIEVINLTVGYDEEIVLKNINFSVNRGEIFAILGGSGVGKSTILKHMIGLYKPLCGDIIIDGINVVTADDRLYRELTKKFGVLYQSGALFSSLTLIENVSMPLMEYTAYPKNVIHSLAKIKLDMVGLEGFENYMPHEISGGMKKRAAIARALALDPDIIFFDEPSSGLDPVSAAQLDELILDLKQKLNVTIVVVTHDLECLFHIADRVIFLERNAKGVIAEGNPRELRESTVNDFVKNFLTRQYSKDKICLPEQTNLKSEFLSSFFLYCFLSSYQ